MDALEISRSAGGICAAVANHSGGNVGPASSSCNGNRKSVLMVVIAQALLSKRRSEFESAEPIRSVPFSLTESGTDMHASVGSIS